MRLTGSMVDRLPPEKREKMERTLRRMEKTRRNDDMYLRDVVKNKLDWAKSERQKGFDMIDGLNKRLQEVIKDTENRISEINKQILKLDGIVLVLDELNEMKSEGPTPVEKPAPKTAHKFSVTKKAGDHGKEKKEVKKSVKKPAKKSTTKKKSRKTTKK